MLNGRSYLAKIMIENHEKRIEMLEKNQAELLKMFGRFLDLSSNEMKQNQQSFLDLHSARLEQYNLMAAIGRCLLLPPGSMDEKARGALMDAIARLETQNDAIAATIATLKARMEQPPLSPGPKDSH